MITAATCLAMALYYEARGEGPDGMRAVGEVIVNRVAHPDFPSTVCEVVKEDRGKKSYDCQFSFYCDGKPEDPHDERAWRDAIYIVHLSGLIPDITGGATHYHSTKVFPE